MKPYSILLTLILSLFGTVLNAQSDAQAKALLDKLSAKTKAYTSMKADFNYILENKAEGINETQSGAILVQGERYKLQIAGQEIMSDGKTIWTYLKDAEEVQITEVDDDNVDQVKPGSIFTMYETGYRHEFKGDQVIGGVTYSVVNIYPLDVDEKSFHTVKLYIDKSKTELKKIEIMGKEGDVYTYKIKSFQANVAVSDSDFVFQKSKYPDAEIVDLR